MPFCRPLAGSWPFVHTLAESSMNVLRNGPGRVLSMPDGKNGCAEKLIVRLVTAVPGGKSSPRQSVGSGQSVMSSGSTFGLLNHATLRDLATATSIENTV